MTPTFYEFFAGGGMARAGLGPGWRCLFANDFDFKKAATYEQAWGTGTLKIGDIRKVKPSELPESPDLVWASFPCQDLSLAGGGAGLKGERSGTFWPFWKLVLKLREDGRAPTIVALENVCGAITSHNGKDFAAISKALALGGYRFGAMVIDAAHFVPQSRPRLFFVGIDASLELPQSHHCLLPSPRWHSLALRKAWGMLPKAARENWVWWNMRAPEPRESTFADFVEEDPKDVEWHRKEETEKLLSMMSPLHMAKVENVRKAGKRMVGTIYKRTRLDENGVKVQRAEVRFDNVAGCLRTPAGGSSRQVILVVDGSKVRSRLISARETARLMGLPDTYKLPSNYNEAYHLTGDGVVVPVVRHLAKEIFEPILQHAGSREKRAAA